MSTLGFLAALPALLAITGFVAYRLLGTQSQAQQVTRDIVAKLRRDAPAQADSVAGLGPRQLAKRLAEEAHLRRAVNEQDYTLLARVSQYEFVKALVVYSLTGLLFAVGVAAFVYVQTRPTPLALSDWHIESAPAEAKGLAVDTDDLVVTWKPTGPREDVGVVLENAETGSRSEEQRVSSAEQRLTFPRTSYERILRVRDLGGRNRIRAVARTSGGAQLSSEVPLIVGINVTAIPVEEDSALWISALIDNAAIPNYVYKAKVIVWPKHGREPLSFGDEMKNPKTVFAIQNFANVDFNTLKIAYFGPDDPRIVRTGLLGHQ
jgi:hypothetical protein